MELQKPYGKVRGEELWRVLFGYVDGELFMIVKVLYDKCGTFVRWSKGKSEYYEIGREFQCVMSSWIFNGEAGK